MTNHSSEHFSTKQVFPLSYGQRALWFLQQLAPDNVAYNLTFATQIHDGLDISALRTTFQVLVDRHPVLRTTFKLQRGQPIQLIHNHQAVAFTVVDGSSWSSRTLHKQLVQTAHQPFDLSKGSVLRVHLFTLDSQTAVLLLAVHHIVVDFRSFVILIEELRELYPAIRAGKLAKLPPIKQQYTDYVRWQLQMLAGETGQTLWSYWKQNLAGELPVLRLPTDRLRPSVQTYRGAVQTFQIPIAVIEGLRKLAKRTNTTIKALLLVALYTLLYQETHQTELCVGSPVAGRSLSGLERTIGYFHNPIVLRANLAGNPSFEMLIRQVQSTLAAAEEHQDYPFPLLVERLQYLRNPSYSPIFQVMFALYQPKDPDILPFLLKTKNSTNLGGLELESLDLEKQVAMLDLTLTMVETRDRLAGSWQYNTDLFDVTTITRLTEQFQYLLTVLVTNPEHRLEIQPTTLAKLTTTENSACLQEMFAEQAVKHPLHLALIGSDYQLSYSDLELASNQLANHLQSLGVKRGDKIGLCVLDWRKVVIGLLGILKVGGIFVPLPPTLSDTELTARFRSISLSLLLTESKLSLFEQVSVSTRVFYWDRHQEVIAQCATTIITSSITPDDLAWIIPSAIDGQAGVSVSHQLIIDYLAVAQTTRQNQPNLCHRLPNDATLDSAILQLLGPLLRGQSVEISTDSSPSLAAVPSNSNSDVDSPKMDFSLFFFSSDGGEDVQNKYQLLIRAAQFADTHDFSAIWTPERHFHSFGGPFPNPSVTSAALATLTKNIQLLAGSVVLPLHHPLRVAEEWAIVDNLSQGRVGLSVASGWHINDFVFAPDCYQQRRDLLQERIQTLRQIWRGEILSFPGVDGEVVKVQSFPRPIQSELPIWLTTAFGNPETFKFAGRTGLNILTHLLGQNIEDLAEQIALYRHAWKEHGHSGSGNITVMLHTFVDSDLERVRETVREPFCNYLKSSVSLIKNLAHSDGSNIEERHFTEDNIEAILDYAFNRYFKTSSLFGTPSICQRTIDSLKQKGVDEIACLVDFGVDSKAILDSLEYLNLVRQRSNNPPKQTSTSIEINNRHQPEPANHSEELVEVLDWWESFLPVETKLGQLPNSRERYFQAHILDSNLCPVPSEVPGELYIGGNFLPYGYSDRPGLTAERFIPHPWSSKPGDRLYKTGQLWRSLKDNTLELLGKLTTNATIKGHSVELETLATIIAQHPEIHKAIVLQRTTRAGKLRLVAGVIFTSNTNTTLSQVSAWLSEQLTTSTLPANTLDWVSLPMSATSTLSTLLPSRFYLAPRTKLEQLIADLWQDTLSVGQIGVHDSFYAFKGTIKLAKQAWNRLQAELGIELPPINILQHTTIKAWADYCRQTQIQSDISQQRQAQVKLRKQLLQRKRQHKHARKTP